MDRVQAVVLSRGKLQLENCDFSGSSSSVLVYSEPGSNAIIRNTVLGDKNCETKGVEPLVGGFL